jgi:hypothetical protein
MNTKTDDTTLALWLDDELQGAELAAFENSLNGAEDLLARRQQVREWRAAIGSVMPIALEPPYPEFFNNRIEQAIRAQTPQPAVQLSTAARWRVWWMPATAVAGMVLAFWVGTKTGGVTQDVTVAKPGPSPAPMVVQMPTVYTPERGVDAEWFSSTNAAATVIVLEGVDAIPDTMDFSETVRLRSHRESTAGLENTEDGEVRQ